MRVFKTRVFAKFARKKNIADASVSRAVAEIEAGLNNGDLGGGLVKKRLAGMGRGKSGSYRMLVAFKAKTRAVVMYGFAKNEIENIAPDQQSALRDQAAKFLAKGETDIVADIAAGRLEEIDHGTQ